MFTAFSVRDSDLTGLGCGPSTILVSCAARFQKHPVFPALGGPCESLPSRLLNASPWLQPTHQAAHTPGSSHRCRREHASREAAHLLQAPLLRCAGQGASLPPSSHHACLLPSLSPAMCPVLVLALQG